MITSQTVIVVVETEIVTVIVTEVSVKNILTS